MAAAFRRGIDEERPDEPVAQVGAAETLGCPIFLADEEDGVVEIPADFSFAHDRGVAEAILAHAVADFVDARKICRSSGADRNLAQCRKRDIASANPTITIIARIIWLRDATISVRIVADSIF